MSLKWHRVCIWRPQAHSVSSIMAASRDYLKLRTKSRKEESFGTLFHCMRRIETQLDKISSSITTKIPEVGSLPPQQDNVGMPWLDIVLPTVIDDSSPSAWQQIHQKSPRSDQSAPRKEPMSFSGRLTWSWPSLAARLPQEALTILQDGQGNYTVALETARQPLLPPGNLSTGSQSTSLPMLSVSAVRALSTAYFTTFNLGNPILDREFFLRSTLPTAISTDFGYNVESCVVLVTMALGAWGQQALEEAGFDSGRPLETLNQPSSHNSTAEIPGIVFFNESRQRMAFLLGNKSLQSCQCHLLTWYVPKTSFHVLRLTKCS